MLIPTRPTRASAADRGVRPTLIESVARGGAKATRHTPLELATKLGDRGIFTWDGNYYAINLTERLGVEKNGGFLRIGFVHYNTEEEVDRVLEELATVSQLG